MGLPLKIMLTGGQACDLAGADALLSGMAAKALLADRAYDADKRVPRDDLDERRIASFRNAPERAGHCLIRMLPWPLQNVNRLPIRIPTRFAIGLIQRTPP